MKTTLGKQLIRFIFQYSKYEHFNAKNLNGIVEIGQKELYGANDLGDITYTIVDRFKELEEYKEYLKKSKHSDCDVRGFEIIFNYPDSYLAILIDLSFFCEKKWRYMKETTLRVYVDQHGKIKKFILKEAMTTKNATLLVKEF